MYLKYFIVIFVDRNHDAVRDLESLKNRDDVGLGAMLALVYTHKKFSSIGMVFIIDFNNDFIIF